MFTNVWLLKKNKFSLLEKYQVVSANQDITLHDLNEETVHWIDVTTHLDTKIQGQLECILQHYTIPEDIIETCLTPIKFPELSVFCNGILMRFPCRKNWDDEHTIYVTILCLPNLVVSIQTEPTIALNKTAEILTLSPPASCTSQSMILVMLDAFGDENINHYMHARMELKSVSQEVDDAPQDVTGDTLLPLRRALIRLSDQFEDQFFCFSGLQTLQHPALSLNDYQRTIREILKTLDHLTESQTRLEKRSDNLYNDCHLFLQTKTETRIRVLTILTILAMPFTIVSGIYGMNFEAMPGLKWEHGYPLTLGLIIFTVIILLFFFKKNGWFD